MSMAFTQTTSNGKLLVKIFTTESLSNISKFSLNASYATSGITFDSISFPGNSSSSSSASLLGTTGNFSINASVALAQASDGLIATMIFTGVGQGVFDLNVTSLRLNGVNQTIQDPPSITYDFTPPVAVTFSPLDGATGVVVGTDIVIAFNENVQRGTGSFVLTTVNGATVETYNATTSSNLSIVGNKLTINPSVDLAYGTAYKIEFATGAIKDMFGNSYIGPTNFNFVTLASTGNKLPIGDVAITGYSNVGQTLAAGNSLSDLDGLGIINYQWSAMGSPISGAVGNTFTITQDQIGKTITVAASYTDGSGILESVTSKATGTVTNISGQTINGTDAIIRNDLVIFGTYKLTAATQVASGVTITVLPGATFDLNGHSLLNYGTISLDGNATAFAALQNGTYKTDSTSGALVTSYGNLKSVVVDGFFSGGTLNIANSLIENSRIDALVSNSISHSIFKSSPLDIGTEAITIDQVTFSDSQVSATAWPFLAPRTISNSNFVGPSPVIYLSPFFSGLDHSLKISGSYIAIPIGRNFESMVYDATDDLQVMTDLSAATFLTSPITNNIDGFNVGAYTFPLSSLLPQMTGTTGNNNLMGTTGADSIFGLDGADILTGAGGNDFIDGGVGTDVAVFSGNLSNYTLSKVGSSYTVRANTGGDGTDTLINIERLKFADKIVNLTVQAKAANAPQADVQRVAELYVAFFNRVPDADGLEYWIDQLGAGQSISQIAEVFYNTGIQYSSLTGFSADMSNADFINVIYRNVLGRSDGADAGGLAYWSSELASGNASRGSLVSTILSSASTFKGDPTWGWVANLLNNKLIVAKTFAVDMGLNYNTASDSISQGMAIAAAVTPTDTTAAITLIGVTGSELHLG